MSAEARKEAAVRGGRPPAHSRLPIVPIDEINDAELLAIIERAGVVKAPRPEWYQLCAAAPEMAKAWHDYWEATFRQGEIEHETKELMRLAMTSLIDCAYCSTQRSAEGQDAGVTEDIVQDACGVVDLGELSPRAAAAVRFGRSCVANDPNTEHELFDSVYEQLGGLFSDAEIVELVCFAMMVMGAKVAATLELPASRAPSPAAE